jgi:hypothetical protein
MKYFGIFLYCLVFIQPLYSIVISSDHTKLIGHQIWKNECAGTIDGLTTWKAGEEFASLGIGHCIWYPPGVKKVFVEGFPDLISFYQKNKKNIPSWIVNATRKGCPWNSREKFLEEFRSDRMNELRTFLANTVDVQIMLMCDRLKGILSRLPKQGFYNLKRAHIEKQLKRLVQTKPNGLYALVDYVNFKGEGTNAREEYGDKGWGLYQVLEVMDGVKPDKEALDDFVKAAKKILERRVHNSPPKRNEKQWLKGWFNRLETYSHPLKS